MKETHEYFEKWAGWRNELASNLQGVYRRLHVEIREEYSCDFPAHSAAKKKNDASIKEDLLIEDILDIRFNNERNPNLLTMESFEEMLMSEDHRGIDPKTDKPLLLNDPMNTEPGNAFQGFLIVKGGALSEESRHPSMGFCIQRVATEEHLSDFTKTLHKENNINDNSMPKIVGGHNFKGIHVMHTATYQFLSQHFGWSKRPEILHALLFKSELYEAEIVTDLLLERKKVIKRLKNCAPEEIHPLSNMKTVIKYILNGSKSNLKYWEFKRRKFLIHFLFQVMAIAPSTIQGEDTKILSLYQTPGLRKQSLNCEIKRTSKPMRSTLLPMFGSFTQADAVLCKNHNP